MSPPAEDMICTPATRSSRDLKDYHQNGLFQEGHIDLALGHKPDHLCVPRHILVEHSPVFRAMLISPESKGETASGLSDSGDKVIKLPDDDPGYFAGVLGAYESDPALMPHPNNPSFEYVEGVLWLAHKYKFALAIQWATGILRADWSMDSPTWRKALIDPSQDDIRHAIALMNLSRDTNIGEFLACAFYLLCADTKWSNDPSLYGSLRASDTSFLRFGIQKLHRWYARDPQNSKATVLPMDLDVPSPAASSLVQSDSTLGLSSRTWKDFVLDTATIRAVTTCLPPLSVARQKRMGAQARSPMSEIYDHPTEVYLGGITLVNRPPILLLVPISGMVPPVPVGRPRRRDRGSNSS